jgi:hypothetical protein
MGLAVVVLVVVSLPPIVRPPVRREQPVGQKASPMLALLGMGSAVLETLDF